MSSNAVQRGMVLVVDDDPVFCAIMEELLRRQGYEACLAYSVEEAESILCQRRPDLILTDVMMPEVDGLSLVRELRANPNWRLIPTVVVSARVMEADRRAAKAAGADEFIGKPFSIQHLRNMIHDYLPA